MDSYVLVGFGMEVLSQRVTDSCIDDEGAGYVTRGYRYARMRKVCKIVILSEENVFGRLHGYW